VIGAYNREIVKLDVASGLATSFRVQQKMRSKRLAVAGGFIVLEVRAPRAFVGKSLEVLDLRERFGATVLTIKRDVEAGEDKVSYLLPTSSTTIGEGMCS
jgi:K+/H+ antiporter YhaU regulatory subunit KhtT